MSHPPQPHQLPSARAEGLAEIFRLYRPEWVITRTMTRAFPQQTAAMMLWDSARWAQQQYHGRVHDADLRHTVVNTEDSDHLLVRCELFCPVLKGEFAAALHAENYAEHHNFDEYTIVVRDSKADKDLRAYGTRKLSTP